MVNKQTFSFIFLVLATFPLAASAFQGPPPADATAASHGSNNSSPQTTPKHPDVQKLNGTWICIAGTKDGQKDTSYVGVRAVFDGDQMTWEAPQDDGSYAKTICRYRLGSGDTAGQFDWWRNSQPEKIQLRLYELVDDNTLRWATNISTTSRPESFDAATFVFTCMRISDQNSSTASAENASTTVRKMTSFGEAIDPEGNCTIVESNERLSITIPPGLTDYWYGRENETKRFNCPLVLQEVTGDFTLTVRVQCKLDGPSTDDGYFSVAGGLIVLTGPGNYLRHERNRFASDSRPDISHSWYPPLYDVDSRRWSTWRSTTDPVFKADSTWLRLTRQGNRISTLYSDGETWVSLGKQETTFPETVNVGLIAHGQSSDSLQFVFDRFELKQDP